MNETVIGYACDYKLMSKHTHSHKEQSNINLDNTKLKILTSRRLDIEAKFHTLY